jgi:hypothetical protein
LATDHRSIHCPFALTRNIILSEHVNDENLNPSIGLILSIIVKEYFSGS